MEARISMWSRWIEIAIEQEQVAREARHRAHLLMEDKALQLVPDEIAREMRAAMVAISAAAHALDALYGEISGDAGVPMGTIAAWNASHTRRCARILETLRSGFSIGPHTKRWAKEFTCLFDLRDSAVHAMEYMRPAVQHATGSWVPSAYERYSLEAAERAITLVLEVFDQCAEHPNPKREKMVVWAAANLPGIRAFKKRRPAPPPAAS